MRSIKNCCISLLFSLALNACGGGSDGASLSFDPEANLPQNLNGELAGQLVFESYVLDLNTGVSVSMDLLTTEGATTPLSASSDGSEIYSVTDSCRSGRPQGLSFSCFYVRSDQGLIQEKFEIPFEGLKGAPNVSPDSQLIAIETRDSLLTNDELLFYRRNGDLVTSLIAPDGFDWLNDGRGIYTRDQNLWITAETLSDFDGYSVFNSFNVVEGKPRDIAVSPNGMQAVFSLENRTVDGVSEVSGLWMLNLDSGQLERFAQMDPAANGSGFALRHPVWSPDGQWVLASTVKDLNDGHLVALRSSILDHRVVQDSSFDSEDQKIIKTLCNPGTCTEEARPHQTLEVVSWTTGSSPDRSVGSLPESGSGFHAGLQGRMVYYDHNIDSPVVFKTYDLLSGEKSDFMSLPPGSRRNRSDVWNVTTDSAELIYNSSDDVFYRLTSTGVTATLNPDLGDRGYLVNSPSLSTVDPNLLSYGFLQFEDGIYRRVVQVVDLESDEYLRYFKAYTADWLPNGDLLLAQPTMEKMRVVDVRTGEIKIEIDRFEHVYGVSVSPDGQQFAMVMMGHIWVSDIDGSNLRQVTHSSGNEAWPEWSPDGRYLIVQHSPLGLTNEPSTQDFFIVAADATRAWVGRPDTMGTQAIEVQFTSGNFPYGPLRWR